MVNLVLSTSKLKIVNVPSSIVTLPPSAERMISLAASNVMSAVMPLVSMISPLPAATPEPDISKALLLFFNAPIKTPPSLNRTSAPSASRMISPAASNVISAPQSTRRLPPSATTKAVTSTASSPLSATRVSTAPVSCPAVNVIPEPLTYKLPVSS